MKKNLSVFTVLLFTCITGKAQLLSWSPDFVKDNDNISIILDATKGNQGLNNYSQLSDVYIHTGVITSQSTSFSDWRYVKFNQNFNQPNPQLQATSLGSNKWKFDITNIRAFYGVPPGETILKISVLFRNGNGTIVQRNTNGSDMYIPIYSTDLAVRFSNPLFQPTFIRIPEQINKQAGDNIALTAISNINADNMKIYLNGTVIQSTNNINSISANPVLTNGGTTTIVAEATVGSVIKKDTFQFFVSGGVSVLPLPTGVRDGINYLAGNTAVTLVLNAPGKGRVSVIGDFPGSNWQEQTAYAMHKTPDGNYWWLQINGLTPGTEYSFQYLVDGILKVGEPYAEKILDPFNDNFISGTTYSGIKVYPTGLTTGNVSVLQTAAPAYNWTTNSFLRPDKRNLVIYEMLVRDFVAAHDWKTIRDTLNYLQQLGINAIQLMPVNEFDGNESWGYNPAYFMAPDKYYGPKNSLKEFIDSCHRRGIAVIMDIALNHTTGANPLAALYWNSSANQPAANNPWLNQTATHPFNVFNDFNHESLRTRYFTSRVVEHWLQEYKIDGFRFDLSKGFTQVNSGTNVGLWSQYDASRVAIWKRYYDTLQLKSPGSYAILEHFADNSEEIELSNYGMMLWGNNTTQFQEAAMGYIGNSNFEGNLFTARNWSQPYLVGYMESHDEERLMYKNLQFGNAAGSYNTRDLNTALKRMQLTAAFFFTMPGPKMIWQFGELGYDYSINYCTNGTVNNNCRLDNKPIRWDYKNNQQRNELYQTYSALNKLRFHPLFKANFTSNRIGKNLAGGFKWLQTTTDTSNICVIGNFDVTNVTGSVTFQNAGIWYDYLNGGTFTSTGNPQAFTLQPGEFRVYINRNISGSTTSGAGSNTFTAKVFPNPLEISSLLELEMPAAGKVSITILNSIGQKIKSFDTGELNKGINTINIADKLSFFTRGIYILTVTGFNKTIPVKILVK